MPMRRVMADIDLVFDAVGFKHAGGDLFADVGEINEREDEAEGLFACSRRDSGRDSRGLVEVAGWGGA